MWLSRPYYMGYNWNVNHVDFDSWSKGLYTPIVDRGFNHLTLTITIIAHQFMHMMLKRVKDELGLW